MSVTAHFPRGVTPSLRDRVPRPSTRAVFQVGDGTAGAAVRICCGRCELDADRDDERSCGEQRLRTRLMARADVSRRGSESECGDSDGVPRVWSRCPAPHVLADERHRAERHVVAGVVAGQSRKRRPVRVMAPGGGRLVGLTPDPARQGGVLPDCQREDHRNQGCSKHVKLAGRTARRRPSDTTRDGRVQPFLPNRRSVAAPGVRDFPPGCRKSRSASSASGVTLNRPRLLGEHGGRAAVHS